MLAVGAGMAAPAGAQTALTSTRATTANPFNTTQTQIRNGSGTTNFTGTSSVTSPTLVPVASFDINTGILVGARFSVNIPYTLSLSALGTVPAAGNNRRVDATSNLTGSISIAGTSITTPTFTAAPKCIAGDCGNLSKNNTDEVSGTLAGTATVAGANLALLTSIGAGTVNFTSRVNATNTTITNAADVTQGSALTQFLLGGTTISANQYNVTYDYLNFSRPSFSTPTQTTTASINFGTVFRNSGTLTQAFNVSNLVNTNNGGLAANTSATSLTSVTRATSDATLSTTLTSLSNLGGGNTAGSYNIAFNPTTSGAKSDTFTFRMTDTPLVGGVPVVGAVGTRSTNLTYQATANVVDRASPSFSTSSVVTTAISNFGNVYRDAGVQTSAALTLANAGGSFAVPAILNGVITSGGFTTSLSSGLQVINGSPQGFTTSFNPGVGASGVRGGTVLLALSDVTTGMAPGTTAINYNLTVNTAATVWDRANPQFAATLAGRAQPINFGTVFAGSTVTSNFALTNVAGAGTNRVATSLNSVNTAGAGNFSTNLAPISSLAAGNTTSDYTASINSATRGQNNGTFVLNMADVAPSGGIAGAGNTYQLTLSTTANVVDRASPSFSTSSVVTTAISNFGNVYRDAGVQTSAALTLANAGGSFAVPAILNGVITSGGFTTSLSSGLQVINGSPQGFTTSFNPGVGASGVRGGTVLLALSDVTTGMAPGTTAINYNLTVNTAATVWDRANPQFAATLAGRAQPINFGTVFAGSTVTSNFALTNVAGAGTNRVATSLNSVNTAGAGNFSTNLAPISSLAAGNTTANYTASFMAAAVGVNNGSFVLNMADVAPSGGITGAGSNYQLTLSTTANVINYANPSFNGLTVETSRTLDFGTVSSRGGPALLNFSLFNIGDINSAGLELYQINGPANSLFTSTIVPFQNLAGGANNNYSVSLNPLNLGIANGVYTFLFRDYAPGVVGGRNYALTLSLVGSVFDPVPEPATWMTMVLGFGLVGAVARRRAAASA